METLWPVASLGPEMQDIVLVLVTVAFFMAMFALLKGLDRI
jgi:hypothetical protein